MQEHLLTVFARELETNEQEAAEAAARDFLDQPELEASWSDAQGFEVTVDAGRDLTGLDRRIQNACGVHCYVLRRLTEQSKAALTHRGEE